MTPVRTPTILAATALLVLAAGCSSDDSAPPTAAAATTPAPAITTAAPSPSPTGVADPDRAACHHLSYVEEIGITAHFEPVYARPAADYALQSDTKAVYSAGFKLATALQAAENGYGDNLNIERAWLDLAEACGDLYGDGPW